jgi:hypothetical protein
LRLQRTTAADRQQRGSSPTLRIVGLLQLRLGHVHVLRHRRWWWWWWWCCALRQWCDVLLMCTILHVVYLLLWRHVLLVLVLCVCPCRPCPSP